MRSSGFRNRGHDTGVCRRSPLSRLEFAGSLQLNLVRLPGDAGPVETDRNHLREAWRVLSRLSNMMTTIFMDPRVLEPGKGPELPIGSKRVAPEDPLSDWIIPDYYVPGRVDCL